MTQPSALPSAAAMGVLVPKALMGHYDLYARVEGIRESTARVFACAEATNMAALNALRSSVMGFGPEALQKTRRAVVADPAVQAIVLRPIHDSGGVEEAGRATSAIAELINRLVDENVRDMTKNLNDALVVEHHMELDVMHTYITNENDKSSVIFEEVMEDRKKRIASSGDNARAKMEAKRLEAQKAFVDEGLNLKPKMEARQKYQLAIDELRKGALTHDLTNPMCDLSAVENESKRETLILAQLQMIDRAIKAVYGTGLGQFDQKASSVGEDKPRFQTLWCLTTSRKVREKSSVR